MKRYNNDPPGCGGWHMSQTEPRQNENADPKMRFRQALSEILQDARDALPHSNEPERVH